MLDRFIRSEAHFAAMLFCELRRPSTLSKKFLDVIGGVVKELPGEITHVFVELAPFRDKWKTLGDHDRWLLVKNLLHWIEPTIDPAQIGSMFGKVNGEMRSPASWDKEEMHRASSEVKQLYFMFRARPDLLVITTRYAIRIELKVDSGTRGENKGFWQPKTQRYIARAAHLVVPGLENLRPLNISIQRQASSDPSYLTWQEIVGDCKDWDFEILKPNRSQSDMSSMSQARTVIDPSE